MIDNANNLMQQGCTIASERCIGVNDNMNASHFHDFYEIYYLESGERYHLINDQLYHITAGQFIIFEPYVMHRSYGDKNMPFSRLLVYFKKGTHLSSQMETALSGITGAYQFSTQDSFKLHQLLNNILLEQENPSDFHKEYLHSILLIMLIFFFRHKENCLKESYSNKVTAIISYINTNYAQKITIELLAKHFYMSPYYLCRKFKEFTNSTIIQQVNATRVINAQKLLLSTNRSITDIATDVGFDSLTHFERIFKNIMGISPSESRKNAN